MKRYKQIAALLCAAATAVIGAGCQNQQNTASPAPVIPIAQQSVAVQNDPHIPAAQKALIEAEMARQAQMKAQPTPASTH